MKRAPVLLMLIALAALVLSGFTPRSKNVAGTRPAKAAAKPTAEQAFIGWLARQKNPGRWSAGNYYVAYSARTKKFSLTCFDQVTAAKKAAAAKFLKSHGLNMASMIKSGLLKIEIEYTDD